MSEAIAREFSRLLTQYLGKETMREVNRKNSTVEYVNGGFCATHDYCDSNVFMWEAVCNVEGLNPETDLDQYLNDPTEFNQSWNVAKDNCFYVDQTESRA